MPYTFSLRRLMIGVTVLCAVAGLAVNFPQQTFVALVMASFLAPATIAGGVMSYLSSQRVLTMVVAIVGALIGGAFAYELFVPKVYAVNEPEWRHFLFEEWVPIATCSTIATLSCGIFVLQFFPRHDRLP